MAYNQFIDEHLVTSVTWNALKMDKEIEGP